MNEAGRNALRAAGLAGVRQLFGLLRDGDGGRCAVGVLVDPMPGNALRTVMRNAPSAARRYDLHGMAACPLCEAEAPISEYLLVSHLNDRHHCDFFKIAELMPVTDRIDGDARPEPVTP